MNWEEYFNVIQSKLSWSGCTDNPNFIGDGLGKIGTTGWILGILTGLHLGCIFTIVCLSLWIQLTFSNIQNETENLNINLIKSFPHIIYWCTYFSAIALFHFLEFFITAVRQPNTLSYESYIINFGKEYTIAAIAGWLEFISESLIIPTKYKCNWIIFFLGLILTISGLVIRAVAMWQCGENFSHSIKFVKNSQHRLVTDGIYRYFRHPSYLGWFMWSIGTQIILFNPICIIGYSLTSWHFFQKRINYEEILLIKFFGKDYLDYSQRTVIGIPFITSPAIQMFKNT